MPLFRDPDNDDYHLMFKACGDLHNSPCIDVGSDYVRDGLVDCDWGLYSDSSDMGAYGGVDSVLVGIDENIGGIPDRFVLYENYPNPFNNSTVIRFELAQRSHVSIDIYDILGRKVANFTNTELIAGQHEIIWNAGNLSSGIYICRVMAGDQYQVRKVTLLK